MNMHQVRAATAGSGWSNSRSERRAKAVLETEEITILTRTLPADLAR